MKKIAAFIVIALLIIVAVNLPDLYGSQSNANSTKLARAYYNFMTAHDLKVYNVRDLNLLIRKLTHFSVYTLTSSVAFMVVLNVTRKYWIAFLTAPIMALGLAITDEFLQTLIPGRTGMAMDVMLDSLGILFGLLLVTIISFSWKGVVKQPR